MESDQSSQQKETPLRETYLLMESNKLNQEIENLLAECHSRERYSLTILGITSAWIFSNLCSIEHSLLIAVSVIPLITTIFYGVSVKYLYKNIEWMGDYLSKIEKSFLPDDTSGFGWERYFNSENRKSKFISITNIIWGFQIGLALALFILVLLKTNIPVLSCK
jgi:hypothetical protein